MDFYTSLQTKSSRLLLFLVGLFNQFVINVHKITIFLYGKSIQFSFGSSFGYTLGNLTSANNSLRLQFLFGMLFSDEENSCCTLDGSKICFSTFMEPGECPLWHRW